MNRKEKFSCIMMGNESHLVLCAEILMRHDHKICGIITSNAMISAWADDKKIPYFKIDNGFSSIMRQQSFDYLFSIANLSIIPDEILALPSKFAINFHDGPLPRYAGAHATSWAIINQEKKYGITWHVIDNGIEKNDILKQPLVDISENETAMTLNVKCYEAGIESFEELINDLAQGNIILRQQNFAERTYFPPNKRPFAACSLFFNQQANDISALVRATDFGPYANTLGLTKLFLNDEVFIVPQIEVLDASSNNMPGTIESIKDSSMTVATASNDIAINRLMRLNGKSLSIRDFVKNFSLKEGDMLNGLDKESADLLTKINSEICQHESFWVNKLKKLQPIELPVAKHNLVEADFPQFDKLHLSMPPGINRFIKDLKINADRCDFLVVAFAIFLARYTSRNIFDIGFSYDELDQIKSPLNKFFVRQVPLRVEIDFAGDFIDALNSIKKSLSELRKHKYFTSDLSLRYPELELLKKTGESPFFSVAMEKVKNIDEYKEIPDNDLLVVFSEDRSTFLWVYSTSAIDKENIVNMQRQFSAFLSNLISESHKSIVDISLLSSEEYKKLMVEWNDTVVDYPIHLCVHRLIEAQVEKAPDSVAVIFENKTLTYDKLNKMANQLARYLRKFKIGPDSCIGIYMERSLEMIVGMLAILKAGGAYLPLDHTYPSERLSFMLEDAKAPVILTQERIVKSMPDTQASVVCVDIDWDLISAEKDTDLRIDVTPENLSYLIYTSGSTGKPKGVMVCHRNVVNFFAGMDQVIPHEPPGVWLAVTTISFDISVLEIFWTLARGFKIVLYSDKVRDQASSKMTDPPVSVMSEFTTLLADKNALKDYSIPALIEKHKVTHLQCTPSMGSMLVMDDKTREALKLLQVFLLGGEAFPVALARQLEQIVSGTIINMYGPTETTIWSTSYTVKDIYRTVPVGRPIANTEIYILDNNLNPVPIGVAGELFIGGDGVVPGYLNRPNLTAERFIKDPFSNKAGARLYRTGDLARYQPDGNIEFLNRLDHQVKVRGHRIELGEIETILDKYPAVHESVVVAREDTPGDQRLVAYIIPHKKEEELSNRDLRDYMKCKLPEFMVPAQYVVLDKFPLTPNRKIDRKNLPVPDHSLVESGMPYEPPKSKFEEIIADVWQELLKIPKIGINDNFFDLGGHSLLVVKAHKSLHEKINMELSVTDFFRFPTIRMLAAYLSRDSGYQSQKNLNKSINRAKTRKAAIGRLRSQRKNTDKYNKLIYRKAKKEDCSVLAELVNIASGGIIEFLLRDLIPGMTPVQFVAQSLQIDNNPRSYKNAIVAESNEKLVGVALSIPSHFHTITDDMKNLFPEERLEHLKHYYAARVENSLLLENICVDEKFRGKGIGTKLISLKKKKAKESGFKILSLIVFADNKDALHLYRRCGFEVAKNVELKFHEHIPHEGGCVLMKCDLHN